MKFGKTFILLVLAIFLFSLTGVFAGEMDTPVASEDTGQLEVSVNEEVTEDNLQTSEENNTLTVGENDETLSSGTDSEILTVDQFTYSDLKEQIGSGGNINLNKGTYTYNNGDGDTIQISMSGVINGNGAVIDMAKSGNRAFDVTTSGVTIKNLTIINANYYEKGGAIFFKESGTVTDCNFINNTATQSGGAVYFSDNGNVTNCNFANNKATGDYSYGGAVYFSSNGEVTNCNFTDNEAYNGGAIRFGGEGTVTNCNFANNKAIRDYSYGGAIYMYSGSVENCNFADNEAYDGGAVYFLGKGTVENCNFTGNNATTGSAIYFYNFASVTKAVFNSRFLNNRANSEALKVNKNENNITIIFKGNDNLLNAIYSNTDVTFINVTYWSANGISNTGSSPTTPSRSNREAGQNITIVGVVKGNIINTTIVTNADGMIILENVGDYHIVVRHEVDSYYTEIENMTTNMKFYVNVTSQTTHNKTVNITAKSNIFSELMDGKLLFIVSNTDPIIANYAGNGTWWALHTFDDYGDYQVNATYVGLDNVTINNATISVSKQDITPDITIPSDITFGDSSIEIKLPSDAEGNVTLKVDGEVVDTVSVTNGIATVKLPELSAGNHKAEITYSGDDKYNASSKNTTLTVNKDSTKISAADATATYKVNKYLVIKVTDSKGNPMSNAKVTVNLNDAKNYATDKNGQVKIKISTLVPKTYTAKITFAGNENYTGFTGSAKVVVKKATPKITAANKMFKTKTKTKKYTITLKDNTGKAIRNAKVTLKVNGKTYNAKTNSKGKATFKITKLNKKGTFKAVITYKGSKYYNKASKKVSIKVISTWKTISKGSKLKSTVKEIQRALKNNGYYLTAHGHYLKVDGVYWDYTVKAVKQFQKAKGLKVTGKVEEKTAKKLGII
ncbi:Ig-like domain repeat protein [Methanobrevibacter sp.]